MISFKFNLTKKKTYYILYPHIIIIYRKSHDIYKHIIRYTTNIRKFEKALRHRRLRKNDKKRRKKKQPQTEEEKTFKCLCRNLKFETRKNDYGMVGSSFYDNLP